LPERLNELITTIYALPGIGNPTIFLSTVTPSTRNGAMARIIDFNAHIPDIIASWRTAGKEIYYVDQFTVINSHWSTAMNGNVHPNPYGNNLMAQEWYDCIQRHYNPTGSPTLSTWQMHYWGAPLATNAVANANPDHDQLDNLSEFAFGSDPLVPNTLSDNVELDGEHIRIQRRKASGAGLTYEIQETASLDPANWVTIPSTTVASDGDFETVEITKSNGWMGEGNTNVFLRFKVMQ
jgi:hypothetical protein